MFGYRQAIIDDIKNEELLAEWKRTSSTTTVALPLVFEDETDLSVRNTISYVGPGVSLYLLHEDTGHP